MTVPIRMRLAAWYFAVMLLTLSLFGLGMFVTMRLAIGQAVDRDLRLRLAGVEEFLGRHIPQTPPDRLRHEIRERTGMRPGGELLQIESPDGGWLFQSDAMRQLGFSLSTVPPGRSSSATIVIRGVPVRVLTERTVIDGAAYGFQLAAPMDHSFTVLSRFGWLLLASIPVLVALASIGGYVMSQRALAPIHTITEEARLITAENLSRRLAVPAARDELQRLSLTLNEMIDRLQHSFLRITHFTADASHELRTPVSLIRSTAELALMESRNEEAYRAALRDNLEEAVRMTGLIEDLLTLARADSGDASLGLATLNVADSLQEAFIQATPLGAANRIDMRLEVGAERMTVMGDSSSVRRLFLILIDNAIKYTPAGGWLAASARCQNDEVIVELRDNGIGISDRDLPNIFERFYRADRARSRTFGIGLGLSIAKCIVSSHDATIDVDSAPGHGSTFRVRFRRI
jgi:two-component system, OmpR family, heavy metal sensor histidine kinase CusS